MNNTTISAETLLIELGTEELPPKSLKSLRDAFTKELLDGLIEAQLLSAHDARKATPYASPRRLALSVSNVISAQEDQKVERRGPAIQAAFKDDGQPTPAAIGFAKSCNADVSDLQRLKTAKGEWLSYTVDEKGKSIEELIGELIETTVKRLPIAKRMRWGDGAAEFVRPAHWLIVMYGDKIIPVNILGIDSSNQTMGHRFHSSGWITIDHAESYAHILQDQGSVIARFQGRQDIIEQQIIDLAKQNGGKIEKDQDLLDEVTGLVEYPNAIIGKFSESFLEVPQECLISSMRDHQKYFHIIDRNAKLLPYFITISNINSKNIDRVREGNERVLRARLSDAQFFWETDKKHPLESNINKLENVLFHVKLGSVLDKSKRIAKLAAALAIKINADVTIAERGALLAKADLVSNMVGEFDELQGIMGHYYADLDNEESLVGDCIEQHYWPKFSGDNLPESREAQAVSLADKLDSLVGIFAAGETPTGDKDPYALRRAALGILRILIEQQLPLSINELVAETASTYQQLQQINVNADTQAKAAQFISGRLAALYQTKGIATNTINAVLACESDNALDFHQRLLAVHAFSEHADAENLAAANKRISNILKKQDSEISKTIDPTLFIEAAEKNLFSTLESTSTICQPLFAQGNYAEGLQQLAELRAPVDTFFDEVMVMSDDKAQQQNRLALLEHMRHLFLQVADIALLQQ